jgi:hypothetical protein
MNPSHPERPVASRLAPGRLLQLVPPWLRGSWRVALLIAAAIAGYVVVREHWDHVTDRWVVLLLLACPLMHVFRDHGGHTTHGEHHRNVARDPKAERAQS